MKMLVKEARQLSIDFEKPLRLSAEEKAEKVEEVSPLMVQWCNIKEQYPDALLLFRVGDFYEAYREDAENVSRILGITLTHRGTSKMKFCGFPFHALDTYLPKLVRAGKRVAICDELKEPYYEKKYKKVL